jgi:TRAP-type transport system periplasmic protein
MRRRDHARIARVAAGLAVIVFAGAAAADPIVVRLSSVAPEGTAWARELRAFGREVGTVTNDEVQIKWYLSGIAGDELSQDHRVKLDQLDGMASGGMLCQRLAPSMRAAALVGEFRDRAEANFAVNALRSRIEAEMLEHGYVYIGPAGMGFSVIFSKKPVRTMADLRALRPWLWNLDDGLRNQLDAMGLHPVPLAIEDGGRAFDDGRIDGFVSLPSAALAFQWSTQARYVIDLRVGYLTGCLLVARRAWDTLGHEQQQLFLSATAKMQARLADVASQIDHQLLSGLFARQGLTALPVPPQLQAEFSELAKKTLGADKPPLASTLQEVARITEEYRRQEQASVKR